MLGMVYGRDEADLREQLAGRDRDALIARGMVVGTPSEVRAQLDAYAAAGVQRAMLQWLDLDDLDRLEHFMAH
jgi:alkanesulfonate monooxygenase SsuD/methylene tetrahydromethanopterin reductase-like flavin-dependent oxidoreductase (luciferase family)